MVRQSLCRINFCCIDFCANDPSFYFITWTRDYVPLLSFLSS